MDLLSLDNAVFEVYVIAAALAVLKLMLQGWMTVYRMLKANSGWASPEDLRPGLINRAPNEAQLEVNEFVDRSRRMHRNDLENIPGFLIAGLLFVVVNPILLHAQVLMYGFVLARLAHFAAYVSKQSHEVRAIFYTIGSMIVIYMAAHVLWSVLT
ncbi:MAPEG family protein [Aliiroseovarius subalbicans]|uniref:MAPEG family protein n=1 Tax=Aliiroseovarius subalbicans TaxID=2925840 RepID=UPI001F57C52F|nr:MAPEG family protein [Aliiroseovarius subalbicans]MCI2399275.1 MAPEG family protein [Aliiroseovarius subalbicans]